MSDDQRMFEEICAVADPFVAEIKKLQATHPRLEISYTKNDKLCDLRLIVSMPYHELEYHNGISFSSKSGILHLDYEPLGEGLNINRWVTYELNERFNIFQSACLDCVDFLFSFCQGKQVNIVIYTPRDINTQSIVIFVKRTNGDTLVFAVYIYKNDHFDDEAIQGVITFDAGGRNPCTFFTSMQEYKKCIKDQYDRLSRYW